MVGGLFQDTIFWPIQKLFLLTRRKELGGGLFFIFSTNYRYRLIPGDVFNLIAYRLASLVDRGRKGQLKRLPFDRGASVSDASMHLHLFISNFLDECGTTAQSIVGNIASTIPDANINFNSDSQEHIVALHPRPYKQLYYVVSRLVVVLCSRVLVCRSQLLMVSK